MTDINQLAERLEKDGIEVLHVGLFDYASIFRERRLRREQFLAWARDPRFSNTLPHWDSADSLFGSGPYLTEALTLDPQSLRPYGFEPNAAAVIADYAGPNRDLMPRAVLARQIERAEAMGFEVRAAFEFEVIFLEETAASLRDKGFADLATFMPENKCWSGQTAADQAAFVAGLERVILDHGISLFAVAGELGPGCFEATLAAETPMKAADDAAFFRLAARSFARSRAMTASFMASMGGSFPGIGGHVTLSLRDKKTGRNVFSDPSSSTNDKARQFIAGMARLVPEAFALCAHTVNAYRRFAPGSWAPKSVTWAEYTFTTAVRSVPSANDSARLEFRLPGADCNPHLTLALALAGGLDGIEERLTPPEATPYGGPDDIPPGATRLPRDLLDAAERLKASALAARNFGSAFTAHFAHACEVEHAALARAVSAAELARYLEG
ncbi:MULTISPECIES: glutamine synthetase [Alphaproteobacteria]|uniref:Glutamine synthetase n=2 Tax=Alphaproteobacteria TaxID=28211 RepID=A0A512HH46_9HYPH|nr:MULTISPECIES: glutamine synthetase [Alphaproteobacteria]GEO84710.1 glutamine synthetase [Ciceribacter naphthalenivorans]GLR20669.1 glutamine synthetase [Ciceribacter naphthalenivorans]GLT03525.1 glutamine synthetase [Sphingomonas psychrolutea]